MTEASYSPFSNADTAEARFWKSRRLLRHSVIIGIYLYRYTPIGNDDMSYFCWPRLRHHSVDILTNLYNGIIGNIMRNVPYIHYIILYTFTYTYARIGMYTYYICLPLIILC